MGGRKKVTLFIDTVSPFGYQAYYLLRHDPIFASVEKEYIPIFLGGLMKETGNTPPLYVKNKRDWIEKERVSWASRFSIPIAQTIPPAFPPQTLQIMRCLSALTTLSSAPDQSQLIACLDRFFESYWVNSIATHEPEILRKTLGEVLGEAEAEKLLGMAGKEGKEVLAGNTQRAFKEGAFGLPWMVCEDGEGRKESFFGVDHLGLVREFLKLGPGEGKGWRAVL